MFVPAFLGPGGGEDRSPGLAEACRLKQPVNRRRVVQHRPGPAPPIKYRQLGAVARHLSPLPDPAQG
jgi:hypothetical protein